MRSTMHARLPDVTPMTAGTGSEQPRYSHPARSVTQEAILASIVPDMVRRIVEAVCPVRVILFGSAARGQMGPESDLDVLVVIPDGSDPNQSSKDVYRSLRGLGFATDVLVVGESDLLLHADDPGLIYRQALREGTELYSAKG